MMLPDPELVVVKLVEPVREFEIALQLQGGMLSDRMMRRQKYAKAETMIHGMTSFFF
jgi:hypothetical protein